MYFGTLTVRLARRAHIFPNNICAKIVCLYAALVSGHIGPMFCQRIPVGGGVAVRGGSAVVRAYYAGRPVGTALLNLKYSASPFRLYRRRGGGLLVYRAENTRATRTPNYYTGGTIETDGPPTTDRIRASTCVHALRNRDRTTTRPPLSVLCAFRFIRPAFRGTHICIARIFPLFGDFSPNTFCTRLPGPEPYTNHRPYGARRARDTVRAISPAPVGPVFVDRRSAVRLQSAVPSVPDSGCRAAALKNEPFAYITVRLLFTILL